MIFMTDDLAETYEIQYEATLAMEINNTALCDVEDRVWQVLSFGLLICAVAKNVDVYFGFWGNLTEQKIN